MPLGGGISGIIVIVIIIALFFFLNGGLGGGGGSTNGLEPGPLSTALASCQTGEDANAREDCRIVGFVNTVQAYWTSEFAREGKQYVPAQTTLFTDVYDTGCGQASADVGPFYCPEDKNVYIDLGFFDILEQQYGGSSAPLAQGYVIAHEYGHHIQDLLGTLTAEQSTETGPTSPGVRIELQADCYAGVWAANSVNTGYLEPITQPQIDDALTAAASVGDDRIQKAATGRVNPESWTHGSAEQRTRWFSTGYRGADPKFCDTFNAPQL
jgi:predicted metalloprotease